MPGAALWGCLGSVMGHAFGNAIVDPFSNQFWHMFDTCSYHLLHRFSYRFRADLGFDFATLGPPFDAKWAQSATPSPPNGAKKVPEKKRCTSRLGGPKATCFQYLPRAIPGSISNRFDMDFGHSCCYLGKAFRT